MPTEYRPRLSVDISEEHRIMLDKYLDFGQRKMLFGIILDDLFSLFKKYGAGKVIGLYVEKHISLKDISRLKVD